MGGIGSGVQRVSPESPAESPQVGTPLPITAPAVPAGNGDDATPTAAPPASPDHRTSHGELRGNAVTNIALGGVELTGRQFSIPRASAGSAANLTAQSLIGKPAVGAGAYYAEVYLHAEAIRDSIRSPDDLRRLRDAIQTHLHEHRASMTDAQAAVLEIKLAALEIQQGVPELLVSPEAFQQFFHGQATDLLNFVSSAPFPHGDQFIGSYPRHQ